MGMVAVEGMSFYAFHGVYAEEQKLGGRYLVDVYLNTDFSRAAAQDDLSQTVNYERIYAISKAEMEISAKLIEHVGQRIFDRIRLAFPQVDSLKVRISKISPPLAGVVERVYIEIKS